ncbi:MAG: M36 family metallopeptidase, partial [Myxococcaceae bacterium]
DGATPRMQMYGFDDGGRPSVIVNVPASPTLLGVGGTLGPRSYTVTGDLAIVAAATGGLDTGCASLPASVAGKIAVVKRGTCQALQKATAAQSAGAIGILIASTSGYTPPINGGGAIAIPVISISMADGDTLTTLAGQGTVNVTLSMPPVVLRDGALDNAIVAHEWGHYIQNRLIGNANGLMNNQGGGLGEGWSDFHSMLMVVKEQDDQVATNAGYNGVYAIASYAMQLVEPEAYYFGIRRVPYSTNLTRNGLTFKHLADGNPLPADVPTAFGIDGSFNSESHSTGEVWATMLWECYTALLRDRSRLTFEQAQTRMRGYLVASYKATPSNPTVIEARDALLAVAAAADPIDYGLFWAAFAKRGAGLYATGPDRAAIDNAPVTESYAAGNGVAIVSATLGDSIGSCDHDTVLDNGEKGVLEVTIKNVGAGALSATVVSVSSSHPGLTALTTGAFTPMPVFGSATAFVQLSLRDAPPGSVLPLAIKLEDPGFSNGPLVLQTEFRVNYDVAGPAAAVDDVEVPVSVWSSLHGPGDASSDWAIHQETPAQHWWKAPGAPATADVYLLSPRLTVGTGPLRLTFRHRYEFERRSWGQINFDGAVVELSADDGATWTDVGASLNPGYTGTIYATNSTNPLAGRSALIGTSQDYPEFLNATLDLGTAYAGQTVQLRFRQGSDDAVGKKGWELDDFAIAGLTSPPFPALVANQPDCQNQAPVATIEPAQQDVEAGAQVTLAGAGTDPDGDAIAGYVWTQTSGPTVELEGQDTPSLTFVAPQVSEDTSLGFELRVSDGKLESVAATAEVLVKANRVGGKPGCGCSGGGFGPELAVLVLGALGAIRRRKER